MFERIAHTAARWRDPDHRPRVRAVEATLRAPNRFTPEALTFAINQQMALLDASRLEAWIGTRSAAQPLTLGVFSAGNVPLVGLQDLLAVTAMGYRYLGSVSKKSDFLLPAFAREAGLDACFDAADKVWAASDAVIVTGADATRTWAEVQAKRHGIPRHRCLLRGHSYSAAVVDGRESAEERERLAEDALLHEGLGCRSVALVWAPETLSPDPYLESFAHMRAVFPVHRNTPGTLAMQQALLKALDASHAYGEGLEFLVSRGPAEVQAPGHIRWVPYRESEALAQGLLAHRARLQCVYAREGLLRQLPGELRLERLGMAQRPALDWQPDGKDTVAFLACL